MLSQFIPDSAITCTCRKLLLTFERLADGNEIYERHQMKQGHWCPRSGPDSFRHRELSFPESRVGEFPTWDALKGAKQVSRCRRAQYLRGLGFG